MSAEAFDSFRRAVLADPVLQRRLQAPKDWDRFAELAVREASALGLEVGPEDLADARDAGRRAWIERWIA